MSTELSKINPFIISRLKETVPGQSTSILYYGKSGSGKTWFAGTSGARTLFINIGGGIDTLLGGEFRRIYPKSGDMLRVDIEERIGARGTVSNSIAFDATCDAIDYALKSHTDEFDTVVIDDATALNEFAMYKALQVNQNTNKSHTQKNVVEKYDMLMPAMQDWAGQMALMDKFINSYIDILYRENKHLIVTAHEKILFKAAERMGGEETVSTIMPHFTGNKKPDAIPKLFNNVWRAEIVPGGGGNIYRCRTQGDSIILAKSRNNGVFGTVESNPNFFSMVEKIKKSQTF